MHEFSDYEDRQARGMSELADLLDVYVAEISNLRDDYDRRKVKMRQTNMVVFTIAVMSLIGMIASLNREFVTLSFFWIVIPVILVSLAIGFHLQNSFQQRRIRLIDRRLKIAYYEAEKIIHYLSQSLEHKFLNPNIRMVFSSRLYRAESILRGDVNDEYRYSESRIE